MAHLKYYQFDFKAMGSPCSIQLYAKSEKRGRDAAEMAITDVNRLEALYSRYRADSFLSEINRVAAIAGNITVDEETAGLLDYAATCYQQSDGLFDITSGILRQAWNFKSSQLPTNEEIDRIKEKIGWNQLVWKRPFLSFGVPGMEIDFGGVVKEYAVDRAAALCSDAGIRHGVVNLGGDIKIIGSHPDDSPWRIAIRHPRHPDTALITLLLRAGAVASSGDYERCITINGMRYGHVLNPKTGWPVRHMAAVSIVGEYCVVAGSASTIGMLKEEQGSEWLSELGLPYLWVDVSGNTGGSLLEAETV
ncbi:FAD:protein FMN transferase [Nitrosomonas sp.]|uniref:FAD:protein FMN transferase n=1 Tax=Nitrosomonas sp. TaxID=42353 RepID=UPI002843EF10|nr:FAD:protein FMN transferase [Nitrosomonas sp.]MCP5243205.1 FAD:protein FMN transferase [Burkholderiales bacterium]MDR4513982.1 FAD:protein FMN transferase [Nitrosomonas sp.]